MASNDSPNAFTTVKTAFSCGENTVFQRRKRHLPAWQHTHYAQHPPSPRGGVGGWGWWGFAATLPPSATTSASPLYKGVSAVLVAEWQQKQEKIFLLVSYTCSFLAASLALRADFVANSSKNDASVAKIRKSLSHLCRTAIMLADVVIHSITVIVDVLQMPYLFILFSYQKE